MLRVHLAALALLSSCGFASSQTYLGARGSKLRHPSSVIQEVIQRLSKRTQML